MGRPLAARAHRHDGDAAGVPIAIGAFRVLDLILRGGRVIDPANGVDGVLEVGFRDGKVDRVAGRIDEPANDVRDVSGLIVAPGLIDLHTHVYWGGTSIGVDPVAVARSSGTTTLVDAGSAGPGNFPGFRHHVIAPSPIRILAYLNISFPGIFAYSAAVMVGECTDIRLLDPKECVRVVNENRDLIVGLKARVGKLASGSNGIAPLDMALDAAAECGVPVMAHIDNPPPSRREVITRLRPGDVLTHCFKPFPNSPIRSDGEIWEEVLAARERGVFFDIGHGMMSFGFDVARRMLEKGFVPDIVSSDVHVLNIDGPVFDLLATLSKFYCLGLDLPTLIRTATAAPAAAMRRPELGHLGAGAAGDATIFTVEDGRFAYADCLGEVLDGRHRLALRGIVAGGRWWTG
jgi:dihydroorotase